MTLASFLSAIDHVGVVVDDLDEAASLLAALGLRPAGSSEPPGARTAFFELGSTSVELIQFFQHDTRVERLGDAPARIDHIAFAVSDLDQAITALAALGIETMSPQFSGGRRTCWTVASTSDGVLYQLVERPHEGPSQAPR